MNAKFLFAALILIALLLTGCAPSATMTPAPAATSAYSSGGGGNFNAAPAATAAPGQPASASAAPRLVIKNASLEIVVDSPEQALQAITAMTQELGGFVVSSSIYHTRSVSDVDVPQAKITLRVPAQDLDAALGRIHALVKNAETDISNENVTGQDVTEDYVDLNSRLTNLHATEKQLQQIMEGTQKTEDVLAVYRELTTIRQEIEVTQGKIKFYEQSSSLSAIDVSILARAAIAPLQVGGWQPVGIARNAVQALIETGKVLAGVLIWAIIFVLPIGLLFYLPWRLLRKRFPPTRKTPAPPAAPDPNAGKWIG